MRNRITLVILFLFALYLIISSLHNVINKSLIYQERRPVLIATISRKIELSEKIRQAYEMKNFETLFNIGVLMKTLYCNGELTIDEYHELTQELKKITR